MGGGSQSTNSSNASFKTGWENTDPWSVQTPYLKDAFSRAEDAYKRTMGMGPYKGDFIAQGDQKNTDAFNQAFNFGTDKTNLGYVQNQMDQSNQWLNRATNWMDTGANGLRDLSGDQTGSILKSAGQYADNPYISAAVKASMADAERQAAESTVPNLYRSGASSNALMSDRAALGQGVVDRGLAETAANLSGQMRYNAWDKGVNTSKAELDSRRQGYGALAKLGQDGAQLGITGLAQGIDNQSRLNKMSAAGAEGLRSMRQLGLDNAMQKYDAKVNFPWQALSNFYNIIGNKSWGGTRTYAEAGLNYGNETTTKKPGATDIAGGALGAIGSLFGGGSGSGLSGLFNFL
jgi:hypothetical protein